MSNVNALVCLIIVVFGVIVVNGSSLNNEEVGIYELNKGDFSVKFTNWGATIISVFLPDKDGKLADVVLGYDSVEDYEDDKPYLGALVGRVANRIGGAKFTLNGTVYNLVANEKHNMLHGGKKGFSDVVWKVDKHEKDGESPSITFTYDSADGEEGFPGELRVSVTYALTGSYKLSVKMKAKAINKATPVNLAQHSYWNLGGHNSGHILSDEVQIFGSHITPTDKNLIPTGEIRPIKGTPYDFLEPQVLSSKINGLPDLYDINYVLDGDNGNKKMKPVAKVHNKKSGRVMELSSDAPGVQFYTGNYLKDLKGKGGFVYQAHAGLCLETQGFPDSVNHPNFPSQIINKGETYKHKMLYKFSINKDM
ncbi:hypothetical protein LguiA_018502 [Lonicera macranthoides]